MEGCFPRYRANISIHSGLGFRACRVYTDVYVSRYWTKVAPSVLDATRSDISSGTLDFSLRERGRNYETGHFSQTAAGCRNTKSAHPLPAPSFSLSLSSPPSSLFSSRPLLARDNEIYELYTLYEPSDCGSV